MDPHRPETALGEVYWDIAWSQRTGTIAVSQAAHAIEVTFERGKPRHGSSSAQAESLPRFLTARRLVDPARLDRAALISIRDHQELDRALLATGAISREGLEASRREHARDLLLATFRMARPEVRFQERPGLPDTEVALAGPPQGAPDPDDVLTILRAAATTVIPFDVLATELAAWSGAPLQRSGSFVKTLGHVRLTTDERRTFQAVDGSRRIADLLTHLGWDPARLFPVLYLGRCLRLIQAAVIEPVAVPAGAAVSVQATPTPPGTPSARRSGIVPSPPRDSEVRRRILESRARAASRTPSPADAETDGGENDSAVVAALAFDGYHVLQAIGRGGWGWVYKAHQERLDRVVAIKVLSPKLPSDAKFMDRFFREARSAARLNHPNIVTVYDCSEHGTVKYLVMELVEGVTLRDLVDQGGPLQESEALWAIGEIALALEHAHGRAVLHRDVKPENVFLSSEGVVKLGDWGLAKSATPVSGNLTETGFALGTPNYMSPEQLRASKDIDARADIYSLGATLYFLLTGQPPFPGPSVVDVMASHLLDPPPDPRRRNPLVSPKVAEIVCRAMAKDPAGRFASASEVLDALDAAGRGA